MGDKTLKSEFNPTPLERAIWLKSLKEDIAAELNPATSWLPKGAVGRWVILTEMLLEKLDNAGVKGYIVDDARNLIDTYAGRRSTTKE